MKGGSEIEKSAAVKNEKRLGGKTPLLSSLLL